MCGSFLLMADVKQLLKYYVIEHEAVVEYEPGAFYPSKSTPIIYKKGKRSVALAKWGFTYSGKKGLVINARSETVISKPMFKDSYYSRRCIIPANLFYEWKDVGDRTKIKHEISLSDNSLISLGGIYKISMDENLREQWTFVIMTTEAMGDVKAIHPRMPLIMMRDQWDLWLDNNTPINLVEDVIQSNALHRFSIQRCKDESANTIYDWRNGQITLF